jgi:hypothetical protein
MRISRRDFGLGLGGLIAAGAAALGYRRIFGAPPTPYDDLLHQIVDRKPAALLGKAVIKTMPNFDTRVLAAKLRQPGFVLQNRARADAAAGRVIEAGGWIVPETVALYSALAASFA